MLVDTVVGSPIKIERYENARKLSMQRQQINTIRDDNLIFSELNKEQDLEINLSNYFL